MTDHLRLLLAQCNFCVGDISGNTDKIIAITERARDEFKADAVVFPELAVTGYPPEDLLFRPGLHRRVKASLSTIAEAARGIRILVGYPEVERDLIYNSCASFLDGECIANYRKQELPNYAVFDEKRYFEPGTQATVIEINGVRLGISICEDIWSPASAVQARDAGAEMICNINASPFHRDKHLERLAAVSAAVSASGIPVAYVNTVGGQDELIFDGGSFALDASGRIAAQAGLFDEAFIPLDISRSAGKLAMQGPSQGLPGLEETVYRALVLGIKDYIHKNRFGGTVLGVSGGIDSALTLALAVDALGPKRVVAISMPSKFTADMSVEDAREEAQILGCEFHVVPIEKPVNSFTETLAELLGESWSGVTGENIQARSRGVILMAVSNATGNIVLATGNKSEMAVGYATLYGDMAGGFAPLKDIPKTLVYRLARWRNQCGRVIPERVITRPPTAELAPGQKDSDSLPSYDVLDPILERYIEEDMTPREISEQGFDTATVRRVVAMVDRNEYKRRQAAPGVRITKRAFGRDRRFPITSRYSEQ
jgi:NAD+ synthase (glutamine-hydrolysing)